MSLRITTNVLVNQTIRDINANLRRLQELQKQISTGKALLKPSDDPIGVSKAMRYTKDIDSSSIYQGNIQDGLNRLRATERVLSDILDIILQIQEIAREGMDVTASTERPMLGDFVNSFLEEILHKSNSKFQGKFIFGGMETLSGTGTFPAPFNPVYDSDGYISGVIQNIDGIDDLVKYEIDDGQYVVVNISGSAPFQPNGEEGENDLFETIINIRDALKNNDIDTLTHEVENLDEEYDNILKQNSLVGTRISELENRQIQISEFQINLKESLSSIVDVDLAQAAIEQSYQSFLYQTSIQVGARIIPQSLLDFI